MPKTESSSKGKGWVYSIILALGLLAYSFVTGNNPFMIFNFSAGVWLVASLLGAVFVYIVGERLIKKWGFADFSAKATRVAFAFAALVVALIGISQIWSGGVPNFGWLGSIYYFVVTADPGQVVIVTAVVLLTLIILYGAAKDAWSGKGIIAIKMWRTAFAALVVFAFLFWLIGTYRMGQVGGAMQGAARTQLDAFLAGQPVAMLAIDWGYVALGFLGFAFLIGLWKMKIIQAATMLTGAIVWLPFIAWLAWGSLPADYKADVSGALSAANETVNPFLGKDHFVDLQSAPGHRLVVANIGPYDTLTVMVPDSSSVDWQAYPGYESVPGYDPTGYYLYNTTGQGGWKRYYDFTEEFEEGLNATGKTLTLEIWAVK
ncbi:MAG: hypothetical protein KBD44_01645 [Candidatus Pacebacteria bacterium]|nr:hypothetical protein [Candidatus Paceibacterota bacterium]